MSAFKTFERQLIRSVALVPAARRRIGPARYLCRSWYGGSAGSAPMALSLLLVVGLIVTTVAAPSQPGPTLSAAAPIMTANLRPSVPCRLCRSVDGLIHGPLGAESLAGRATADARDARSTRRGLPLNVRATTESSPSSTSSAVG